MRRRKREEGRGKKKEGYRTQSSGHSDPVSGIGIYPFPGPFLKMEGNQHPVSVIQYRVSSIEHRTIFITFTA
jgi:hypothetical protein